MKRLLSIVLFCVLVPCAYGETINYDGGDKYVGEVSNGVPHGQGTYTFAHGDKYIGEWKNFLYHGHGMFRLADGAKYIGEFKDDKKHGQGTYIWVGGSKYIGEWKDGNKWTGTEYTADGSVQGIYTGGIYEAEVHTCVNRRDYIEDGKNMIDCEFADGERYVGGFENGAWNGQGTYFYASGAKYIGEYKDGLSHGHGTYIHASGEKYIGEFKDELKHGYGTNMYVGGDKYIGEYKDGNKWNGTSYTADGTVRGTHSNGEWIAK